MTDGLDGLRQAQRRTWSAGDYAEVGKHLVPASEAVVARAGIEPGMTVLDVATGTGNAALLAAEAGAAVTGVDFTPGLLEVARERAGSAGLEVEFVEGDAEALPVAGDGFDRVLSVFGVMFAAGHARAASELWRVCRPGGLIVLASWTPTGGISQIFAMLQEGAEPPPPGFQHPPLWGSPAHLAGLFPEGELSTSIEHLPFRYDSVDEWLEFNERNSGPVKLAKQRLEADGRWDDLRRRVRDVALAANRAADDGFLLVGEYLLAVVNKPSNPGVRNIP